MYNLFCYFTPGKKRGPKPKSIDTSSHAGPNQFGTFQILPLYFVSNSHGEPYLTELCYISNSQEIVPSQTYVNDNYNTMQETDYFPYKSDNFSSPQPDFYNNHHALANDLDISPYEQPPPEFCNSNNSQGFASSNAYNTMTSIDDSQNTPIDFNSPLPSIHNSS
ncbi:14542_t:CDS:1 [Acaulospora morrowiae]|uniref:14542_t:CDS:1 n=1 Tax=Acaulospora morrowiae TaxID=94023 RepID=A0A9N9GRJ0_9GLOM|nr:14542_t:CDS:1 [Acaulospora morrowiae]